MGSATTFKGGGILSKDARIILIDESHAESLQKALRSAEIELSEIDAFDFNGIATKLFALPTDVEIADVAIAVRNFKPE